jgi:hypothetical protein
MSMETGATSSTSQRGSREQDKAGQSRIVNDLVKNGTVKSNAQPVVIVVREHPFAFLRSLWTRDD